MTENDLFPFSSLALRIEQPLGVFYVTKIRADILLQVTFTDTFRVEDEELRGSQREEKIVRLREIARFIETSEAAFPNSVILAANYNSSGMLVEDEAIRWRVETNNGDDCLRLIIPTRNKLASIIDGQHRLRGFLHATKNISMELLCAVYFDLPNPYQAQIFATINFNQKRVDKSLAYQLFGFNVEEEPAQSWSPEKTAVFLSRKLNTEEDSPFYQRIKIAAKNEEMLFKEKLDIDWKVSTAVVVDGIMRLFSANPQKDRDRMYAKKIYEGRDRSILEDDGTPLRRLYLQTNDKAIYTAVKNYFIAVKEVLWSSASKDSYIKKTVGIQALFDILRLLLKDFEQKKDIRVEFFRAFLEKARHIDFADNFFQASGKGRTILRNAIEVNLGFKTKTDFDEDDWANYSRLTGIN
ncbi:MAG: DGQHR domain-containing protein [Acidobacteria bacterium]|nr:DGQHR domain-containing protein [Acidobacteriota bacterium]